MNNITGIDIVFPREYLRAALIVSLLSVWVLVGLFYYLNRYTKRNYFTIWTAAWIFYAVWLTLGIVDPFMAVNATVFILRQWCVSLSAVCLLWGSLVFLEQRAPQRLFACFILFLLTWSLAGRQMIEDPLIIQAPIFALIGLSSMFAGFSFYHLRKDQQFVAAGMLCLGFALWGAYLIAYPFSQKYSTLYNAGFLFSAVLQLFIAVSMIVLVLEEARLVTNSVLKDIEAVNSEKRELQLKVYDAEEKCRSLFDQARSRQELQSAYEELRRTQQSVVQQERLRALGQMASGVAHDINNALSPIVSFSEMILRQEPGLASGTRKHLEHIQTAAADIGHIVTRMSEFYRIRENQDKLRMLPPGALIQQVVELTSPRWRDMLRERGSVINVETRLEEPLPDLYGNESELREALTNVVLNAVDALPEGGRIVLSARALHQNTGSERPIRPTHLELEISDNGTGMDEGTRQRCLEPFFSTKQHRGGSGLGLAMVYGAMKRHQGQVEIQSEIGKGTTIRLIFPFRQPPAPRTEALPESAPAAASLRILCIDDEPLVRAALVDILQSFNYEVETANNGESGVNACRRAATRGVPFNVVITDLGLPDIDGRQVARKIRSEFPKVPIIMLTGWGSMMQDGDNAEEIDALLSKPIRLNELIAILGKVSARVPRVGSRFDTALLAPN